MKIITECKEIRNMEDAHQDYILNKKLADKTQKINLKDAKIVSLEMHKIYFEEAKFTNTDFVNVELSSVNFKKATFKNCTFINTNLQNCDFTKAKFTNCVFIEVAFTSYKKEDVKLEGCTNIDSYLEIEQ